MFTKTIRHVKPEAPARYVTTDTAKVCNPQDHASTPAPRRRPRTVIHPDRRGRHRDRLDLWPARRGKTTLAASYLEARKLPSIWYQVDSGDADPATFLLHGLCGCPNWGMLSETRFPLLPSESPSDIAAFTRLYFSKVVRTITPADCARDRQLSGRLQGLRSETLMRGAFSEVPDDLPVLVLSEQPTELPGASGCERALSASSTRKIFALRAKESKQVVLSEVAAW